MKILVCIPCLLTGGTEIQTLNLVQSLTEGGHHVTTVCYFEYSQDMVMRYENSGSKVICLRSSGERLNGIKGILFLFKKLAKTLRQVKPDVIHVQYMAPGAIPVIILKLLGTKKIIATAHTAADIYPNLNLIHFIQKHCVKAFTCISETAEKSFFGTSQLYSEKTVLKKRNHFTIYNALSPVFSNLSCQEKTFDRHITVGVVSRLEKIKGMDLVIPAFAKVLKEYPDANLIIVGDGSLKAMMQQQADNLDCQDKITWTGRQPQEKLPEWYRKIDILLMPSRSEGFGLTAIEAMACGCVVVASRTGGLPEVVKDHQTGLLHNTESVEDIAEKTLLLINNRNLLMDYSTKAQAYSHKYSLEHYSKLFNDLYSKL